MTQSTSTATRTYRGSCHCGGVRFEADIDLSQGTSRCNCTYCSKTGWWGILLRPPAFRLLSGGEHELGPAPSGVRPVCPTCGIIAFGHGDIAELGGEFYSVNVRCLDDADVEGVTIRYLDGRHDTWAELAASPYKSPYVGAGAPGLKPAWQK